MPSKLKQSKKEKITLGKVVLEIEKLAQATAKGFAESDVKINELRDDVNELKTDVNELKGEVGGLKYEMNELKGGMNELKERVNEGVDKMLTMADKMARQFSDWKQENIFATQANREHQDIIDNHEIRIKKLEEARKI